MHRLAIVAALVLAATAGASAEETFGSDRVRLKLRDGGGRRHVRQVVGRLVARDDATLTLRVAGGRDLVVRREQVRRFERSLGRQSRGASALRGAAVGFAVGAVLGAGAGALAGDDGFLSRGEIVRASAGWFGGIGAAAGAVGGALGPGESWKRATPDGPAFSIRPARAGAGLELAFRF